MILGILSTAESAGDIMGAQFDSLFTEYLGLNWHYAFFLVGMLCLVMTFANVLFLIKHPEDKGIEVEEIDDYLIQNERIL